MSRLQNPTLKAPGRRRARLTEGPVGRNILKLALPMIWGIFVVMAFNLADTFFVAQLGTRPLAAMSFTFPVVMLGGSMAIGLGVGASSVISRAIGRGERERVQRLTTDSLSLTLLLVGALILLGLVTMDPLFTAMGAGPQILPLIREYMTVWYVGMFFLVVPMVGNSAIRATGDTLTPSLIMTAAGLMNITMDPVLIFGLAGMPRLGLRGAALATVFSRGVTLLGAVSILHFREKLLVWKPPHPREVLASWREILHIGLPAAATQSLGPLANGLITSLVAVFGAKAVAGFGVATRLEAFALIAIMGLSAGMGPFVGQNWGAGARDRVQQAVGLGFRFALAWSLLMAVGLSLWGRSIALHFNADPVVVEAAALYLLIVPWSYAFEGWRVVGNATFNALGKPLPATLITLTKLFLLYLPLAWLGSHWWHLPGIFVGALLANLIAGLWSALWVRQICGRTSSSASEPKTEKEPDSVLKTETETETV